jgi:hypothetical protein
MQQVQDFEFHLLQQYRDRTIYWSNRAVSRIPMQPSGCRKLCVVTDAIDHNKFRYPRSRIFGSKEFASTVRPTMDMTCVIAHGYHIMLALSEPFVPKNSSWCTELLSHMLDRLGARGVDLRTTELHIQSDNCSRETKNNTLTRWAALMTSSHKLKRIQMDFLVSGHSHEDIDAFFAGVSNLIESCPELHEPGQFIRALEQWLADPNVRQYEKYRSVLKVDQVRDWCMSPKNSIFTYVSYVYWESSNLIIFLITKIEVWPPFCFFAKIPLGLANPATGERSCIADLWRAICVESLGLEPLTALLLTAVVTSQADCCLIDVLFLKKHETKDKLVQAKLAARDSRWPLHEHARWIPI